MSGLSTTAAALLLIATGFAIGWQVGMSRHRATAVRASSPARRTSALRALCVRAIAICADQVSHARSAGDAAVHRLTVLFSSTAKRLGASIDATRGTVADLKGDGGIMSTIERSEADLRLIVDMLQAMHRSRETILVQVNTYAGDLKEMAADVEKISMQVRLLSFNAAVEAARDMRVGAGFSVVAREMRDLAAMTAETASRMVKKVESIDRSLETVFADEGRTVNQELASITRAEDVIRKTTDGFRRAAEGMSSTLGVLEEEAQAVHREISDALFALQFQDRVSQIQAHVATNLADLCTLLQSSGERPVDGNEWLRRMALDFIADDAKTSAPSTSTTFF